MPCSPLDDLNNLDDDNDNDRRASFNNDEDRCVSSDDDDEDRLLTQPPSLCNTTRDAERVPFFDSVRRVIDNESAFNLRNNVEYSSPMPPPIVIPDNVSSAIRNELRLTWSFASPRSYQIHAIFHLVYKKTDMMWRRKIVSDAGNGIDAQGYHDSDGSTSRTWQ